MFDTITIKQKTRREIVKRHNYDIKKDIVATVTKNGDIETTVKILNPDQQTENTEMVEQMIMSIFYPDIKDLDDLEVHDYENKKKELMEYFTKNKEKFGWIVAFNLCKDHEAINKTDLNKKK